ncbi:DUF5325 family protein [Evansella cellulosilytica]|uniref:Uncharacterized protein n=1 Tax=Evansella cellulosilytica (strain ATCC 21833 / DSM 2522 / FERM P-1141 / JCM 9156 / N-4) TaxID=649639 RepID=E6TUL8_EVAC2|nr:DUF5325 family protein [Evansella cellulosilytica]ADU30908.1 hypothetical protein Bcell_2653 [Evansella cellulosilytica DSM 2522]
MQTFNWVLFSLAILGTTGLLGIGFGIAMPNTIVIICSIILTILSVVTGFSLKRKMYNKEEGLSKSNS